MSCWCCTNTIWPLCSLPAHSWGCRLYIFCLGTSVFIPYTSRGELSAESTLNSGHCPIPSWEKLKSLESVVCEARQAAIKSSVQVFFSLRRDPTSGALLKKGPLELDIEEWVDVDRTSLAHVIKRNWSGTSPASKRAFRLASSCLHLLTSFGVSYKFTCHINSVVTRHGGACLQSQNSDGWGRRIEFKVWSCIAVWD